MCSGLTYGPAATTATATKIQRKATDKTTTVAFKDLNHDRKKITIENGPSLVLLGCIAQSFQFFCRDKRRLDRFPPQSTNH